MKIFISGGAGFIGSNIARRYLEEGADVFVYDNLSRKGTEINLKWLKTIGGSLKFVKGDVRDFDNLKKYIKNSDIIYHTAGQVAVTTSIKYPREDFEVNALGTLNVLEAMRKYSKEAVLIYASTNKVYGNLEGVNFPQNGINESQNLDFHSPYGCSKGVGDQYVYDYGRVYGLRTVVFRQSCIYGERQLGNEDQGWVMHFVRSILKNHLITIYGDGKQRRDILDVRDLIRAFALVIKKVRPGKPMLYNIGGGVGNTISLLQLIKVVEKKTGCIAKLKFEKPREGDQRIYVSDNGKITRETGWKPKVGIDEGIGNLINLAKII